MCGGGACMAGVMCGGGGMHGGRGMCGRGGMPGRGWGRAWQILRDTVNERAVRILLECILVTTSLLREKLLISSSQFDRKREELKGPRFCNYAVERVRIFYMFTHVVSRILFQNTFLKQPRER